MLKLVGILGGLGLGLFALSRGGKRMTTPNHFPSSDDPGPWKQWIWPMAIRDGRVPVITDRYHEATKEHRRHLGVDMMYPRRKTDPTSLPTSTKMFTVPPGTPAIAAFKGKIWSAGMTPRGLQVTIDHGNVPGIGPTVTWYQHLQKLARSWAKGDVVETGQVLGIVGGDIIPKGYPLHHLHFGLWFPKKGIHVDDWAANPAPYMKHWKKIEV